MKQFKQEWFCDQYISYVLIWEEKYAIILITSKLYNYVPSSM